MEVKKIKEVIDQYGSLNFRDLQKLLEVERYDLVPWRNAKMKMERIGGDTNG